MKSTQKRDPYADIAEVYGEEVRRGTPEPVDASIAKITQPSLWREEVNRRTRATPARTIPEQLLETVSAWYDGLPIAYFENVGHNSA